MRPNEFIRRLLLVMRFLLGLFFVLAALSKIADSGDFPAAIENYRLVPSWSVNLIAIVLPWLEFVAGILLIAGIWRRESALLLSILMGVFLIAIFAAMARGLDIECGCFGSADEKVGWSLAFRDMVLFAAALILAVTSEEPPRLRTIVSAAHSEGDLKKTVDIFEKVGRKLKLI